MRTPAASAAFLAALTLGVLASAHAGGTAERRPSSISLASQKAPARVLQGPMVGFVSDREARIWVRVSGPSDVRVRYAALREAQPAEEKTSRAVRALRENDHTAVIPLMGLSPDTAYRYRVLIDGKGVKTGASEREAVFRTLPPAGRPGKFRVAFGSCASVDLDPVQRIWRAVARSRPRAFLWLGDNVYGDSRDPAVLRRQYRRQRAVRNLLDFQASVPQLAIWDDHDYGLGDGDRTFPGKEASTAVFREYWANPRYGLAGGTGMSQTPRASQTPRVSQTPRLSQTPGASQTPGVPQKPGVPQTPGVFFRWSIGDVDFFLLDGRTFRDPNALPDGPGKTQLGVRQKRWLKSGLKKSRAVFKVLVSPGAWTEGKGPGGDSWASFLHERDELFDFIRDEGVTGVFLLAGDAHRPQMNVIPRSARGGYDLYEVISSPLAQTVERGKLGRGEKGGFRRVRPPNAYVFNFGLLEFDTAAAPPRVTIRLIDAEGKSLWRPLVLTAEDLKPGARSRDRTVRD